MSDLGLSVTCITRELPFFFQIMFGTTHHRRQADSSQVRDLSQALYSMITNFNFVLVSKINSEQESKLQSSLLFFQWKFCISFGICSSSHWKLKPGQLQQSPSVNFPSLQEMLGITEVLNCPVEWKLLLAFCTGAEMPMPYNMWGISHNVKRAQLINII